MSVTLRGLRISGLVLLVVGGAVAYSLSLSGSSPPETRLGTAGIAVSDDTARLVERVVYRQDVVRIGDVVVVDGAPRDPITDPAIASMWEIVDSVWPTLLRSDLRQLSVIEEDSRGLVGVVHPANGGGWILSLDLADIEDRGLVVETIVHELSHVVTLDAEVFTFDGDDCDGARIDLGCAAEGSVLARFSDAFWPGDVGSDLVGDYVNEYAMTAAHEDLAETFTAWVLDWPVGGENIDAKIAILAADPELSALADELRAAPRGDSSIG